MTKDEKIYLDLIEVIKVRIPDFRIEFKNESFFMKFLSLFVGVFNRRFMTDYITTIGRTVYFPNRGFVTGNWKQAWKILAHEYVHLLDRYTQGIWYNVRYLFPQILAMFALIAIGGIWFHPLALFVAFVAALFPWPAPGRTAIELRGYTMSMAINFWRYGNITEETKTWIVGQFTGPAYYFMWPYGSVWQKINQAAEAVTTGEILKIVEEMAYRDVSDLLKANP